LGYLPSLFDDVELRLRRHAKPEEASGSDERENDIGVLRFEELSDGEQMVLSRMALFHLLEGQQDALLLLDEPETHFNDKWKREIVDIIDGAIGQTANDVLISTHSAIVLSDVFNDEIVMVQKTADGSTIRSVTEQTFATDPSALMMTVFEADDSIGKRAQEFIEDKLRKATGTAADIQQLEQLITRMGSGFYRSELRTLLNKWKDVGNA
jgi:ABC-type glutathione transport system ATPase component